MKNIAIILSVCCLIVSCATKNQVFDPEYVKVTNERADNIVYGMSIGSEVTKLEVRDLIAEQYRTLNWMHEQLDKKIAELEKENLEKAINDKKIAAIKAEADADIAKLHRRYVNALSKKLNDQQVTQVKDGMTYGVVELTYAGYLDMIPELTEAQKKYIYSSLVEAREHAMDAGSSKDKHGWFGKYKGRINNYLSAEGYDLNKASHDWHERIEARKKAEN